MAFDSSSNSTSPVPLLCGLNASLYPSIFSCFMKDSRASWSFISFTIINVFFLPLYTLSLWKGLRGWRRQSSAAPGMACHSDVLTHQIVLLEVVCLLGNILYCFGMIKCSVTVMILGYYFFFAIYPVQTLLHCLSCVERYVAVVHPITYRALSHSARVRVRNISIGCVWLLCIVMMVLIVFSFPEFPIHLMAIIYGVTLLVIFFCSPSVIFTMIHLGLGKVSGGQEHVDQSKMRAFIYILAITGVLALRSSGILISYVVFGRGWKYGKDACVVLMCGGWLCIPSSLVPPLFFLHRQGALPRFGRTLNKAEN